MSRASLKAALAVIIAAEEDMLQGYELARIAAALLQTLADIQQEQAEAEARGNGIEDEGDDE